MGDFFIWGRVESLGAHGYYVIVSEVPREIAKGAAGAAVETAIAGTEAEAVELRNALMRRAGEAIRSRGDRVVDVVEEGGI